MARSVYFELTQAAVDALRQSIRRPFLDKPVRLDNGNSRVGLHPHLVQILSNRMVSGESYSDVIVRLANTKKGTH